MAVNLEVKAAVVDLVLTASANATATQDIMRVPNARVLDVKAAYPELAGDDATVNIGTSADPDLFVAAAPSSAAGGLTAWNTSTGEAVTVDELVLTVSAGATAVSGNATVMVTYVQDLS